MWLGVAAAATSGLLAMTLASDTARSQTKSRVPVFEKDVLPILQERCLKCHGGQARMADLDLRTTALILKGGVKGTSLVRGDASKSLLYRRVEDRSMPPGNETKLTEAELKTIRDWINAGAHAEKSDTVSADSLQTRGAKHWSFQPPARVAIPPVKAKWWVRTPVDAFVLAQLEKQGIPPPKTADRRTLLRRVYLNLIGLPPTPQEQEAFLNDRSADAYAKVVESLLNRPEYGERWARHWLDVARYAETNGYERDSAKPSAWRYRDYVIDAFNKDKPYDRFVMEQIAGDEIEGSNAETQIAQTFLRLGTWDDEPADPKTDRYDQLDDVVGVTSAAFMGLTLRCARCHDHKFEPLSQKDYYRMLAIFDPLKRPQQGQTDLDRLVGTGEELKRYHEGMAKADREVGELNAQVEALKARIRENLFLSKRSSLPADVILAFQTLPERRTDAQKELIKKHTEAMEKEVRAALTPQERAQLEGWEKRIVEANAARPKEPPRAYIWYEEGQTPPPTRILLRGDVNTPGEEVSPGFPEVLTSGTIPAPVTTEKTSGRRLWLARWLTRPDHPLTARVMVNRIWQWHFGTGLVGTASDFGLMGMRPTDPALLDWLAREFVAGGWSVKRLHRLIVHSNTFKAASDWDAVSAKRDRDNRLYWRWRPRRLEAEVVRDSMLAVSGQLNPQMGGPSIYPNLPREVLEGQSVPGQGWGKSDERQASRRSVYIYVKRAIAVPELEALDFPDTTSSCENRVVSTVAPQALTFLNGEFANTQARHFAARLVKEAGEDPTAQVKRAYLLALCRPPSPAEIKTALEFLAKHRTQIEADTPDAAKSKVDPSQRALEGFCLALLNSNEFFYQF
jgi:hypothetical protein